MRTAKDSQGGVSLCVLFCPETPEVIGRITTGMADRVDGIAQRDTDHFRYEIPNLVSVLPIWLQHKEMILQITKIV
jgi:hypothetical protein